MKNTYRSIIVFSLPPFITFFSLVIVNTVQIIVNNQCHGSRENMCGFGPTMFTFPIALLQIPAIFTLKFLGLEKFYISNDRIVSSVWIFIGSLILGVIAGLATLCILNMKNSKKKLK